MADTKTAKKPYTRKSKEERLEAVENKIKFHENAIEKLKVQKEAILNPKPRASKSAKMKAIASLAKETGRSEEELLKTLGLSADE